MRGASGGSDPAGTRAERRQSGELESEVLAVLWAASEPLVAAQVQQALGPGLAYNTVHTILTRLHAKGAVSREPAGRAHAYRPVLDDNGLTARQMRTLLERGSDRAAVLRRFVDELAGPDGEVLAALLAQAHPAAPLTPPAAAGSSSRES